MRALVLSRGDRRAFLAIARNYRPPSRTWDAEAWRAVVASDVGTHMGSDRLVRWSTPFRVIPNMNFTSGRELDDVDAVRGLPDEPGAITTDEAARLSLALERLKTDNIYLGIASSLFLIDSKVVGADVPEKDKRTILADARAIYGACVSPPNYHPLSEGIGQYVSPAQESALMQYHGDAARRPQTW